MEIIDNLKTWQQTRSHIKNTVGFVATMGCLHQGHLSLLEKARAENDCVVLSIFVNPTQFNQTQDFENYPKTLEQDLQLAKPFADYVLIPNSDEIYCDDYHYQIHETTLSKLMEGQYRPGHFDGVLTIVMKLLMLIKPDKAYFGEKDYQQLQLINDMTTAFFMETEVIGCPIIREPSGLAFSSRNKRLNAEQKKLAELFAQTLATEKSIDAVKNVLNQNQIKIDYITDHQDRRFAAVTIGEVRLIDNRPLNQIGHEESLC